MHESNNPIGRISPRFNSTPWESDVQRTIRIRATVFFVLHGHQPALFTAFGGGADETAGTVQMSRSSDVAWSTNLPLFPRPCNSKALC